MVSFEFKISRYAQIDTRLRMKQERPRMWMEKKQYFDRNIWDKSIDLTYFVLDILKVGISRSTYYISFERMCLTVKCNWFKYSKTCVKRPL